MAVIVFSGSFARRVVQLAVILTSEFALAIIAVGVLSLSMHS
jgi:hypothetical protein